MHLAFDIVYQQHVFLSFSIMQYILKMAITCYRLLPLQLISSHFITSLCNGFQLAWNVCSSLSLSGHLFLWSWNRGGDHARILAEIIQSDNLTSRKFHVIISTTNIVCFSASEVVKLLSVEKSAQVLAYCMVVYLVFRINAKRKSDHLFVCIRCVSKGCQRGCHFLIKLVDFRILCFIDRASRYNSCK